MAEKINMRSNYPVLKEQGIDLQAYLSQFYQTFDNWFSLNPFDGHLADKQAASEWISGDGEKIAVERIALATGGHHACLLVIIAAKLQGKAIAVEEFSYPGFMEIAKMMDVTLISCKGDQHGMQPGALAEVITKNQVKAVYLMPTLNNPTGMVMPLERRLALIEVCKASDVMIIDDDAYGFLEDNPPPNFAQLYPENGWYIYSLSKPLAPDIKVAFMAFPAAYQAAVNRAIQFSVSNPSTFFTAMVTGLIQNGKLKMLIENKRIEGRERQRLVKNLLGDFQLSAHPNGWHLWLALPDKVMAQEISDLLLEKGIEVIPGNLFNSPGTNNKEFIRIALGGEKDLDKIIKGIKMLRETIVTVANELKK